MQTISYPKLNIKSIKDLNIKFEVIKLLEKKHREKASWYWFGKYLFDMTVIAQYIKAKKTRGLDETKNLLYSKENHPKSDWRDKTDETYGLGKIIFINHMV